MIGDKWRLSFGDRNLYYCHVAVIRLLHTVSHQWPCMSYLLFPPNLRRYEASRETVLSPSKTSNCGGHTTCSMKWGIRNSCPSLHPSFLYILIQLIRGCNKYNIQICQVLETISVFCRTSPFDIQISLYVHL